MLTEHANTARNRKTAILSLVTGALVWGLIWYPYRTLSSFGVDGVAATTATYSVAFVLGLICFRNHLKTFKPQWLQLWLALAAGGCNIGYVVGTLHGEVVRVLLLFYLAPLWTILFSRLMLGEKLNRYGVLIILLSLGGAATILWQADVGLPIPRNAGEWCGLGAGVSFALFNVLSRYASHLAIEVKSLVSFAGVASLGALLLAVGFGEIAPLAEVDHWPYLALIGAVLIVVNYVVQFGLSHVASNRAIVIMLTEVGFASVAAWLLVGEAFCVREAAGGAMIIAASLFSAKLEKH